MCLIYYMDNSSENSTCVFQETSNLNLKEEKELKVCNCLENGSLKGEHSTELVENRIGNGLLGLTPGSTYSLPLKRKKRAKSAGRKPKSTKRKYKSKSKKSTKKRQIGSGRVTKRGTSKVKSKKSQSGAGQKGNKCKKQRQVKWR